MAGRMLWLVASPTDWLRTALADCYRMTPPCVVRVMSDGRRRLKAAARDYYGSLPDNYERFNQDYLDRKSGRGS